MDKVIIVLTLFFLTCFSFGADLPAGFIEEEIAGNLDPSGIELLPDGRILVVQKYGVVSVVENDELLDQVFLQIVVDNSNERGLLNLVIDPNFELNNYFYVVYTTQNNHNRVSRFTANGNQALLESELILYEFDQLSAGFHNGGSMVFGDDGKLYISSGDGGDQNTTQSLSSNLGKIIRINTDGSIPADNPFFNETTDKYRAIYARGFRNPFSVSIDTLGNIFVGEVGSDQEEEINIIESGGNYGWPILEGKLQSQTPPENYVDPIYSYSHSLGGCAIVGLEIYEPSQKSFPPNYWGNILFGDFCNGELYLLDRDTKIVTDTLAKNLQQLTVLEIAPNGDVYYIQRSNAGGSVSDNTSATDGKLVRISYTGSGKPFISKQPQDIVEIVGSDAKFDVTVFGENPIQFKWFLNGVLQIGDTNSFEIENITLANHNDEVYCVISNAFDTIYTDTVTLQVEDNTRPVPLISVSQNTYKAGDTITFSGSATDVEDGVINTNTLRWQVTFAHDEHEHPFLSTFFGENGSFIIPNIGETATDVSYRIYLNAVDSDGFSTTTSIDVLPILKTITITTDPPNMSYFFDGKSIKGDTTLMGVTGVLRQLNVDEVQFNEQDDSLFRFNGFSSTGMTTSLTNVFKFPTSDSVIVLDFEKDSFTAGNGLEYEFYNSEIDFNSRLNPIVTDSGNIDFFWGGNVPFTGVNSDGFYTRFYGFIKPLVSDNYTFVANADDGLVLSINHQVVIDKWGGSLFFQNNKGSIYLEEGVYYPLELNYFEGNGDAGIRLLWESASFSKTIVPSKILYTGTITSVHKQFEQTLSVLPNPAEETITLSYDFFGEEVVIKDQFGKMVFQSVLEGNLGNESIDISGLNDGVYFITITSTKNTLITKKFIKQ